MTPATDTGIAGDQNTNLSQPQFIGQVFNSFPGTVANLSVYVEFNGLHPGAERRFRPRRRRKRSRLRGQFRHSGDDELRGHVHCCSARRAGRLPACPGGGGRPGRPASSAGAVLVAATRLPHRQDPADGQWSRRDQRCRTPAARSFSRRSRASPSTYRIRSIRRTITWRPPLRSSSRLSRRRARRTPATTP